MAAFAFSFRSSGARVQDAKIVDLFAGPGGLDVAAGWLGIESVGVEWDSAANQTREKAGLTTQPGDVRDFGPHKFEECDVLAGGPPCQTFTVAGSGEGRHAMHRVLNVADRLAEESFDPEAPADELYGSLDGNLDERTSLVLEPLRWALAALEAKRPYRAIVLEQVPVVLPVWEKYRDVFKAKGYVAECGVLRVEEFGVPQTRRRAVLIAHRRDAVGDLPRPTHRRYRKGSPREEGDPTLLPWVTMGDVLSRPQPFHVVSNYGTGGDPKARGQRSSDQPAFTVTGKISRNRVMCAGGGGTRFSNAEAGQLQSFPAAFPWSGTGVAQQIGNAVPPVLGVHLLAHALGLGGELRDKALGRAADSGATVRPSSEDLAALQTASTGRLFSGAGVHEDG